MKKTTTQRKRLKIGWIILFIFVLLGIVGGILLKTVFYGTIEAGRMSNKEANRLIHYLSIEEYEYTDRLGSSFSVKQAKKLIKAAGLEPDALELSFLKEPGFMKLSKKQFEEMYDTLIQTLELDRLKSESLYIYDIDSANDKEMNGVLYEVVSTSAGDYFMEKSYGMDSSYIGKVCRFYVSNNEIILCLGESNEEITIQNLYASKVVEEDKEMILYGYVSGGMKKFVVTEKSGMKEGMNPCLCDVKLTNKGITALVDHTSELTETKVVSYADGVMMLDGNDEPFYLSEAFNVYKVNGAFKATKSAGNLIGYDKVSLYIKGNQVEAALLTEDIYAKNIRVLISDSDYSGYYHNSVLITSNTDFTVTYGEQVAEYKAKEQIEFRNGSMELSNGNAKITSKEEDGRITISSLNRQCGAPSYRGTIELSRDDKGVLIINELPVEEYLYGVVPSEMPVTYETEALKAQAICARAYAYRQMESETYAKYGAHLDDSVASQVYNNVLEDERATYAVDDTYGVVPCYNGEVIEAFFFSTSCGTTSNNQVVWGGNQEPYLLDTMETELNEIANLENEESFRSFIDGNLGTGFIEEQEPFFRWNVHFTPEELTTALNTHLYDRINAMSENILVKNSSGNFEKKDIQSIGEVTHIEITKRGASGIIEEMEIIGTAETILVKGQSNARALLSPESVVIRKQDGSTLEGWPSLPSAYFYVDESDGFTLVGGGFGHGVGMSQNGANDMAKLGYYASDILSHYYTSIELKDMYELMGK